MKSIEQINSEHAEKVKRIRAGEIPCDFCNVRLTIPVCPRCGKPNADQPKRSKLKRAQPK